VGYSNGFFGLQVDGKRRGRGMPVLESELLDVNALTKMMRRGIDL